MSRMIGGSYPYMYSMMYSASPYSMPMMGNYHFIANRTYTITMMAQFDDGSYCNATETIHT